jgi:hypothetical protein
MWAILNPDGTIDENYVGATQRELWFEHGWCIMVEKYGSKWEKKFYKRERASINDFKKKGYSFIEVRLVPKSQPNPMTRGELCKLLEKEAKKYIGDGVAASLKRNKHMHEWRQKKIPEHLIDALLVDFINHVAAGQGLDYALYTKDLKMKR